MEVGYMIAIILKIVFGLLFIISGLFKIPDLKGFFVTVVKFGVIKGRSARIFAYMFPFVEIIVGALTLLGYQLKIMSGLVLLLLLISTSGVVLAYYQGKKIDNCGCYGTFIKVKIDMKKILENSIWILFAIYFFIYNLVN